MKKVIKCTIACLFVASLLACAQKSPEELLAAAETSVKLGNYDEAVVNYKNAIQQVPDDKALRLGAAKLYLDIGQYQSAEKEFKRAKELGTQESELNNHIARLLWHLGQLDELIEFYEEAVQIQNDEVAFYAFLAYLTLGNIEKANEIVAVLTDSAREGAFSLLANAYLAFVDEDITKANALLEQTLEKTPRFLSAIKLKALVAINENDFEKANEAIKQYSVFSPYDLREQLFFAATYIQFDQLDLAKPILNELESTLKGTPALDQLLGQVFYIEQNYLMAQQHIEKAIQNGARTTKNLMLAGYVNYALGNFERSYDYLMGVKDDIEQDHPAMKILAISQMKLGKTMEAADILRKSAVGASREIPAYVTATQRLLANGQFEIAQDLVTQIKGTPNPTPFDIVQIGLAKFSVKDPSGIEDIKTIIENNPDMIEAQMALVSIYLKNGQPDELINIAREWQMKEEASDALKIRGFNLEGLVQERLGNNDLATKAYLGALELDKGNIHSHVFLAKSNIENGNYSEATAHIDRALEANPVSYDTLLLGYNNNVAQKKYQAGLDLLANTHEKFPDNIQVAELYAIALHFQGKFQRLLKLANDSKNISDNMYQVIADAHLKLNDTKKAIEVYKEWDRKSPHNSVPFYHYIYLLETESRFDEALDAIVRKRRGFKEDVGLKELQAQFLLYQQKVNEAKELLAEIKKQDPTSDNIENLEAQVPLFERKFAQAIPDLLKIYEAEPTDRKGYNVVLAYIGNKEMDALLTFSEKHLALFPKSMQVRNIAANLYMQQGSYEKALSQFLLLLDYIPDSPAILNNIAWLQYKLGRLDDALIAAERALVLVPSDFNIMDTAALILAAQGKLEEASALAKAAYLKVVELNADNRTEVTINYIDILEKSGDKTEAEKIRRSYGL